MESSRPSSLTFGSFLVYPSTAPTKETARFKRTILNIKEDRWNPKSGMRWPEYAAKRFREELPGSPLEGYFQGTVLVPIPRSALLQKNALWPARRISEALVAEGIAEHFESLLERRTAIRKSAGSGDRPSPHEHFDSLGVLYPTQAATIILVDDVITRGSTALGAAWRVLEAMPGVHIKAFGVARTLRADEVHYILDVQRGVIDLDGDNWLQRIP